MNYIITGASSGLGRAIMYAILHDQPEAHVFNLSHSFDPEQHEREHPIQVDVGDEVSVSLAFREIHNLMGHIEFGEEHGCIDVLINCAGVNHIEEFADYPASQWDRVMDTNAKGIFLMSQAVLPWLDQGTILNIVSNASHMPMRHSAAYNASKGAAHILTLQMARELSANGITVFGISPAKIKGTHMSMYIEETVPRLRGWTKEEAAAYQKAGLLTGEEIEPETLAEFIAFLLSSKGRHFHLSGCILPYGA